MARKHAMKYMGHEKEPPQPHGGHDTGGRPPVHSHSRRPKRTIGKGHRGKRP